MILIIDNGMDYSDHALYFVEVCSKVLAHRVSEFLADSMVMSSKHCKVIGTCSIITWVRENGSTMTLQEFVAEIGKSPSYHDGKCDWWDELACKCQISRLKTLAAEVA